jgi:hypothetical protein
MNAFDLAILAVFIGLAGIAGRGLMRHRSQTQAEGFSAAAPIITGCDSPPVMGDFSVDCSDGNYDCGGP